MNPFDNIIRKLIDLKKMIPLDNTDYLKYYIEEYNRSVAFYETDRITLTIWINNLANFAREWPNSPVLSPLDKQMIRDILEMANVLYMELVKKKMIRDILEMWLMIFI